MEAEKSSKTIEFVVCGRFDGDGPDSMEPGPKTNDLIMALMDGIRRKELNPYGKVSVCNCGQAYQTGPSISILPEQVRYTDVDPQDVDLLIERHLEPLVVNQN